MIKKAFKKVKDDPLVRFGGILFLASMATNGFNYLFQIYMARVLGPADYSILAVIGSLFYIMQIPTSTVQATLMRFTAELKVENKQEAITSLVMNSSKRIIVYGFVLFLLIVAFSSEITGFLNMPSNLPLLIAGLILIVSSLLPVTMGVLQGLQKFKQLGIMNALSAGIKLVSGVLLVYLGFGVNGALVGYLLGPLVVFLISLFVVVPFLKKRDWVKHNKKIRNYAVFAFLAMFAIVILSNIDVILVKHFFSDTDAGYYASASILAKIVVFASGAITTVMASKAAELHARGEPTIYVLRNSLFYIGIISAAAVALYYIAPFFIVNTLFGAKFMNAIPLLGIFSIATAFFSLVNLIVYYDLAIKRFTFVPLLIGSMIVEVALLFVFHSTLIDVVKIVAGVTALLFFALFIINKNEILGKSNVNKTSTEETFVSVES